MILILDLKFVSFLQLTFFLTKSYIDIGQTAEAIKLQIDYTDLILLAGLLISIIMAVAIGTKAQKQTANIWLVGFFVSSATVIIVKFLYTSGYILDSPHWFKVNYPAGILRPLFMYLYIHFLLQGIQKIRTSTFLHFIPFILLTLYLSDFFLQSEDYKIAVLKRDVVNTKGLIPSWYAYFQILYSTVYLILIFLDFRKFTLTYRKLTKSQKTLKKWIRLLLVGGGAYLSFIVVARLFDLTTDYNHHFYEIFSILLILLCIKLLTLPEFVDNNTLLREKYKKSWLNASSIDQYFSKIDQLMKNEDLFRKEDLKLKDIATKLAIPEYLISQIINEKSGLSFRNYLNAFRIKAAQEMLASSRDQYSIEGIARDVGFNSRASFYTAFKKETNQTPTEFLAALN